MQEQINKFLWGFILILVIFFTVLGIYNSKQIKEYRYTSNKKYSINIKIFTKDINLGNKTIAKIKKIDSNKSSLNYFNQVLNILNKKDINSYLLYIDNYMAFGKFYSKGKYAVSLNYKNDELYDIIEIENSFLFIKDVNSKNFDRIFLISDNLDKISKLYNEIDSYDLDQIKKIDNVDIILLKNNNEVYKSKLK